MRTSADITIHRIDGTTLPVPITTEARRTWMLMREDNIRLRWDSTTEYRAKVGDWVDDELFGKFYVTEEQEPTVDTGTGAYRHDIRLDRDYIGWKNVLHMLTYDNGTSRKETDWTLTDSLQNHLTEIVKGLRALGYSCGSPVVESSVENPEVAVAVTFSGTSVYDALNTLAGAYSCEWWVTYNSSYTTSTIHFGKRELSNTPKVITLGDNAEDITPSRGGDAMANRIFAFGSTRNIPETYRKTLSFQVTDTSTRTYDGQSATVFRDSARVVTRDMLKADESLSKGVTLALGSLIYSDSETTPSYKEMAYSSASFTLSEAARYDVSGELACVARFSRYDDTEEDGEWSWLLSIDGVEIASGGGNLTGFIAGDTTITVNISESVSEEILLSEGSHTARLEIQTLNHHFSLAYAKASSANITLSPSGYKLECPLIYNGNTYTVRFNPLSEPSSRETFNWFSFVDSTPSGFGVGSRYTLGFSDGETAGLLPLKTPVSFYSDDMGDLSSLRMVGARRLMLPAPGYVESGDTSTGRVVEKVVIFENIFPKLYLQITDITEGTYTDNTEWSDGSRSYGSLPKYTIKVKRITSSGLRDFNFKRDYLTSDPLRGVFVTRDEARGHGSTSNSRFLLSGMTFGLNFNEAAQTYTIAFNEDYGAKLPNGTLKPEVGDALILTGWNVNAIESLGLVDDAEGDLLTAATTYLTAVSKPSFTWRCRMMSDSMMSDGLLNPGQRVRIVRGNLEDTTRVIGFEYKLDIPEDTPEYECGETEAYSRLRELEKALNAKTVNTASASGGSVTSSSSSSSSSDAGSLSAVLSWQAGTVDPATFDTFDGSKDKLINIPSEIDHLSNGGLVPRIDEVIETLTDGSNVVRLVDGEGNTVLPSGSMDWFIPETYTENGTTKQRLKLNPKYQGMYAEGWVSAGGLSEQSGQTIVASLPDLTDVDDNLYTSLQEGQALVWDGDKWTGGTVSGDVSPATVADYGTIKMAAVEGGVASVVTTVYGNRYGLKRDSTGKAYVDIPDIPSSVSVDPATTSTYGTVKVSAVESGQASVITTLYGNRYGVKMDAAGKTYVDIPTIPSAPDLSGYLPLTAGSTKPLTGALYINPSVETDPAIRITAANNTANHAIEFYSGSGTFQGRLAANASSGLVQFLARGSLVLRSGNSSASGVTLYAPSTNETTNIKSQVISPGFAGAVTINGTTGAMTLGNGIDIGTPGTSFRSLSAKVIYLASGVYLYYDSTNGCVRVHGAGLESDSYVSAGGVSTT